MCSDGELEYQLTHQIFKKNPKNDVIMGIIILAVQKYILVLLKSFRFPDSIIIIFWVNNNTRNLIWLFRHNVFLDFLLVLNLIMYRQIQLYGRKWAYAINSIDAFHQIFQDYFEVTLILHLQFPTGHPWYTFSDCNYSSFGSSHTCC